jgi:hypothetical protein
MDAPQPAFAAGLPFRFTDTDTDTAAGLPQNQRAFVANAVTARE